MTLTPLTLMFAFALVLLVAGVVAFLRDRRRVGPAALTLVGSGVAGLSGLVWAADSGLFGTLPQILLVLILLVLALGYPVLTLFLLVNGLAMVRRESHSLGNLLSLLLGIILATWILVPVLLAALHSPDALLFVVNALGAGYGFILSEYFLVFLVAAVAYRGVPTRLRASHVIILGAGLIGEKVPPLLASRIDQAIALADAQHPPAVLVPSGGKGSDELLPEGTAMARYMRDKGVDPARILVEDASRTTRENLIYSLALLPEEAPGHRRDIVVVTSDYQVFRAALLTRELGVPAQVVGAKTAFYYVPSAFLREFVAVLRQHLRFALVLPVSWAVLVLGAVVVHLLQG